MAHIVKKDYHGLYDRQKEAYHLFFKAVIGVYLTLRLPCVWFLTGLSSCNAGSLAENFSHVQTYTRRL